MLNKNVSIALILVFFGSCTFIGKKLIGYKPAEPKTFNQQIKLAKKLKIFQYPIFELDTNYMKFLDLKFSDKLDSKLFYQPLQVYYFDTSGVLYSFHNNCMYPGFPIIKWNYFNAFDTFPPKNIKKDIPDLKFSFKEISTYLKPINSKAKLFSETSNILIVMKGV